jgi:hypothetical protein
MIEAIEPTPPPRVITSPPYSLHLNGIKSFDMISSFVDLKTLLISSLE